MKFLFKVGLVFLVVFNFLVPVIHYSCALAVIIAFFYYIFFKKSLPFTYFFSRYTFIILAGTLLMALFELMILTLHGNVGVGFFRRLMVQAWMLVCMVFILPILIEKKETAFNEAIVIICSAFALQGLIHTLGFLIPSVGDFIIRFQSPETKAAIAGGGVIRTFRLYALTGSIFFDLPAAYGVACIMFFRLQLIPGQNYLRGWKAFVVMLFMLLGIMLSGRTGFIGFGVGLFLYMVYDWAQTMVIMRNILKITGGFLILLVFFYMILTPQQQKKLTDSVFPFAFEAYYSWRDTGKISTGSTDELIQNHYYSLDTKTIMWGAGGTSYDLQIRRTDAGYMNHFLIGGIFYFLALIIYQMVFFVEPMKLAKSERSRNGNINFFCFFLLFAHLFILEYKGGAIGNIHIIEVMLLYFGMSYLSEQYALEDKVEEIASREEQLSESALA